MEKSASIASLAKALCQLQAELSPAALNATNPFLKNKYADLGSIIAAVKPHLKATGLSYSQTVSGGLDGRIIVTTILMHESGEWIESTVALPVGDERGKSLAQAAGGIITYLRRYSLAAIFGVYSGDDDDGNETGGKKPAPARANGNGHQPPPEPPSMVEAGQQLGGVVKPPEPGTLEWAYAFKTSAGKAYGDLTEDELQAVIDHPKAPAERKQAARMILASHDYHNGDIAGAEMADDGLDPSDGLPFGAK